MGLSLDVTYARDVLVVRLAGELDHHTSQRVRNTIESELHKGRFSHLVINLSSLEFMDSSGLGVILGRYKQMGQLGGKMMLCSVRPSVHRLMEMAGLFRILPIYEDEASAISACEVAS